MIYALFFTLLLALQIFPAPAAAQPSMDAQCEAWLCLPGGFGPAECNPAKAAVDWRLSRVPPLDPLPPWSSCAAHYEAIQANLRFDNNYRPPGCGRSTGHGTVWVLSDGVRIGSQYSYTRQETVRPCPPPPPPRPPVLNRPTTTTTTTPTTTTTTPTTTTTTPPTTETTQTDPCVVNPSSCIEPPPPDPCEVDPASCIEPPPPDPCEVNPASCIEPPPPDPCEVNPASCIEPPPPDPDPPPFTPPTGPPVPPPPAAVGGAPAVN